MKEVKKTKHSTQPPARYNEGSLAKEMEKHGVGRPATRDVIITSIQKKGYVEKEKGKGKKGLIATKIGMKINDYLCPNFKDFFMDIKYTSQVEEELNEIADGKKTFLETVGAFYEFLKEHIKEVGEVEKKEPVVTGAKCTVCKEGEIVERDGRFGKFFSCSKYPDCKTVYVKTEDDKFEIKKKKTAKKIGRNCPDCEKHGRNGELVERKNKSNGNAFIGCSLYPKCRFSESVESK